MSRWKAAAIHLFISLAIALMIGFVFLKIWYPPPFFSAAGADELMLLLVGVDITLGPLITLIIFRSGKPGLKFDLAFIAAVQCCSLAYGLSIVLQSRPVFLVAAIDRFTLVFANDLDAAALQKGKQAEFQHLSWSGPKLVGAVLPTDSQKRSDLFWSAAVAHEDIEHMPEFYVPYEQQTQAIIDHSRNLDTLREKHPEAAIQIDEVARENQMDMNDLAYLPLIARKHDLSMLISKRTGKVIQAISVNPW
jgi:hypothetical protein